MDKDKVNATAAAAARLLAALDVYRGEVEQLVRAGWDTESYRAAADLFLQMQEEAARLPLVHVPWLQVLISRFEFSHLLWESRQAGATFERLATCHQKHLAAVEHLHASCVEAYGRRERARADNAGPAPPPESPR